MADISLSSIIQGTTLLGYAGSRGDPGYTGSLGYTGSAGAGYTGSQGDFGYTGSQGATGNAGYTGSAGSDGIVGSDGYTGSQGYTGSKGDTGETGLGFRIAKSYLSLAALQADTSPTGIVAGEFAIIETGNVEDVDNSKLYLWSGSAYTYVTDLSGAAGITGPIGYTGSQGAIGYTGSGSSTNPWSVITANYTATNGDRLILNTTSGVFNLTLPATPSTGDYIQITDGADLSANAVTVLRNGSTIESVADDLILDVAHTTVEFIYDGATWQVTSTTGARGPIGYTGSAGEGGGGGGSSAGKIMLLSMFF